MDGQPERGEQGLGPMVVQALGGRRGLVDSGLPAVVFVAVNGLVGAAAGPATALRVAIGAALLIGLATVALRIARRQSVQQAVAGFLGLALAAFLAARSGQARDFFLPGIYLNVAYGVAFLASGAAGRPLVGFAYAAVEGWGSRWWADRSLRRVLTVASIGWALVFAVRAGVQVACYQANRPDLLAASRLLLGGPLTIAAVAATMAYVRRRRPAPQPAA